MMNVARWGNQFLQSEEPWKTIKTEPDKAQYSLFIAAQVAVLLGQICEPFMPYTSEKILNIIGIVISVINMIAGVMLTLS